LTVFVSKDVTKTLIARKINRLIKVLNEYILNLEKEIAKVKKEKYEKLH